MEKTSKRDKVTKCRGEEEKIEGHQQKISRKKGREEWATQRMAGREKRKEREEKKKGK